MNTKFIIGKSSRFLSLFSQALILFIVLPWSAGGFGWKSILPENQKYGNEASALNTNPLGTSKPIPVSLQPDPNTVRFAVIGDYGSAGEPAATVAGLVKNWDPDLILTVGDNNYPDGASATIDANIGQYYSDYIYPYKGSYGAGSAVNNFFPALGNHDWVAANAKPYRDYFELPGNEYYYDFVRGPVHFFVLDSDPNEPDGITSSSVQAQWLQNALAASTSAWNIVTLHHAPFSSGGAHGSNTILQWPYQDWGADAVLAGHDHIYERIVKNDFPYFVNGLGGASIHNFGTPVDGSQLRYNGNYGAMLVNADSSNIYFQFIVRNGQVVDAYGLSKSTLPGPLAKDSAGVFRPSNGLLYLKNSNTSGIADIAINYGLPGDYPVVGDWDGNGTVTIGIYRNGTFYLRNANTVGFADLVFPFGTPGDQPIAGDWNNDGTDTIGVYRSSSGQFLLHNSNNAGAADMSFFLGNVGDVGIAGDWDGDGFDTTGVFRPSNGIIFLKNTNDTGFADIALNYGIPGDKPLTGDWDEDGIDTIGVYRNGTFYLRNSNTIGFADIVFALGINGDMPIAGNWDGQP